MMDGGVGWLCRQPTPPSLKMKKACHSERSEESKYFYRTPVKNIKKTIKKIIFFIM